MNDVDLKLMEKNALEASNFIKKLAHPDRLLILCHLSFGELSAGDLARRSQLSLSAFSQHLRILKNAELIKVRRNAQTIYYSIQNASSLLILNTLKEIFCNN